MKRTSLKNKILLNSSIIIAFTILMVLIGFLEFNKSKEFADNIAPLSQQMAELVRLKGHYESFEYNLEEYFIIGGEMHEVRINKDFNNVFKTIKSIKHGDYKLHLVEEIENKSLILNKLIAPLFNENPIQISSREQNELIIKIYSEMKNINHLHSSLSDQTLERLQYYIEAQQNSIKTAILEFFVVGIIILVLYIILGLILSIRISNPLLKLKNAASEIYKGNFNIAVKVDSNDEIGDLADVFNKMTLQIQKSMNDLKDSEEKYKILAENLPQKIFYKDVNSVYIACNKNYASDLRISPEEIIGKTDYEFFPKELAEKYRADDNRIIQSEETEEIEEKYIQNDQDFVVQTVKTPIRDETGNVTGILGIFWDITERKQAEEALLKSERKFRTLAISVPVGIFQTDADGNCIYVNERWCEFAGLSQEEAAGDGWVKALHPDDREKVYKAWYHSAKTGEEFDLEYRFKRPGGKVTWLAGKAVALLNDSGEAVGYLGTITDISERRRMEGMLRESEGQYRNLVETSQDLIWKCDSQGRFTFLNPACESILGYKVEEMLGCHFNEFKPPEIAERDLEVFRKILKGKDFFGYETIYIAKTGEQKNLVFNAQILKGAGGNIIGTQGTAHDITERKRAEDEKANLKAQLVQVQKMEAVGTLAGGIAHDFNNILSSVLGFAELAKMNLATGDDLEKNLDEVMNAGLRARDLVKHILTFSRKADVQKQPTQISLLIKETLKFLRASLPATIEVRSDLGVSDSTVMADPSQIHQILMNLCTNAAHAMQAKGGVLDVRMEDVRLDDESLLPYKELKQGTYLRLSVGDTGDGIPKEIIDRIFDPFFTTKERGEGTGLGLATVHGIVKDMGGTISVYSEPGKGTTFHVLLPKHEGEAADLTSPRYILKKGKGRILFVDDEKGIVSSGRQMLEGLGYEVVTATSSLEALELFESSPDKFDLLLTDMTMPKMTGLELSRRAIKTRPDIPIVLCTGFSAGITAETIRDAGIREMVMKPMVASELAAAVEKALKP